MWNSALGNSVSARQLLVRLITTSAVLDDALRDVRYVEMGVSTSAPCSCHLQMTVLHHSSKTGSLA